MSRAAPLQAHRTVQRAVQSIKRFNRLQIEIAMPMNSWTFFVVVVVYIRHQTYVLNKVRELCPGASEMGDCKIRTLAIMFQHCSLY